MAHFSGSGKNEVVKPVKKELSASVSPTKKEPAVAKEVFMKKEPTITKDVQVKDAAKSIQSKKVATGRKDVTVQAKKSATKDTSAQKETITKEASKDMIPSTKLSRGVYSGVEVRKPIRVSGRKGKVANAQKLRTGKVPQNIRMGKVAGNEKVTGQIPKGKN